MKIAVGYLRCSTDLQDDSVEQQRKAIQQWAAENDFQVIDWYEDEGKSGTSFEKRPAFNRMMRRVESGVNFHYILVYDESRWGRPNNPRENTYWKVHAERYGIRVRVINSGSKNENDIGSFVTEVVESAEASEYSKKLSRSTLRGAKANALNGFSSGGTAPYGYVRVAVDKAAGQMARPLKTGEWIRNNQEKVRWELGDPAEIAVVKRMFQLKVSGLGYVMIADTLNKEGIPCPKRGRWRNKDQKWCQGTIRTIITNLAYCGVRVYNKHPQSHLRLGALKQRWINDEKEFAVLENAHPSIVSRELFQKANISSRGKFGKGYAQIVKSEYLLSGLIKCGSCGFNFSGQRYYKTGNHYYQDSGYINKGRSVCSSFLIQKEKIESFVVQNIKDNMLAANLESRLQHIVEKQLESRLTGKDLTLDRLEKALDANKSQMNNIIEAIAQGIKVDTVLERVSQLEAERDRLLREREKQERVSIKKDDVRELAKTITREVHHFEHAFESAPPPEKKRWIRRFLLGIDVDRAKNRALCYIMKIPMVSHPVMTALLPSESSIIVVAGAEMNLQPTALSIEKKWPFRLGACALPILTFLKDNSADVLVPLSTYSRWTPIC